MACVVIPVEPVTAKEIPDIGQSTREINLPTGGKIIIGKPEDKLGQRLSNTASITFEDVIIQPKQIIGDRRFGFKYIIDVLDYARPMVAAIGLGLAEGRWMLHWPIRGNANNLVREFAICRWPET